MLEKNIIVFVNNVPKDGLDAILGLESNAELAVIGNSRKKDWIERAKALKVHHIIAVDYSKPESLAKSLFKIEDRILAITCRGDKNIPDFAKIVPHVPYLKTPTAESLRWASDKIAMRERFDAYDPELSPRFLVVNNTSKKTLDDIESKLNFPIIIKPAHLHSSLLVSQCRTQKELKINLETIFRKINSVYKQNKTEQIPVVLAEEMMQGDKYSVDAYVDSRGEMYFCPFVYNRSGVHVGFDDFFEYELSNRPVLNKKQKEQALKVAKKAVHALSLCNTSVHIELMQTEKAWKVIEVGARIGGFRQKLYKLSHGIEHAANDVRIHIPQKLFIPKIRKQYVGVFNFYARSEGRLEGVQGIHKVKKLKSFVELKIFKQKGDMCRFAKNGGSHAINIWLANKNLKQWEKDVVEMESLIKIITK